MAAWPSHAGADAQRIPGSCSIERAFLDACLLDVMALKPGNVGVHGAGHGMQALDFIRSAARRAPAIAAEKASGRGAHPQSDRGNPCGRRHQHQPWHRAAGGPAGACGVAGAVRRSARPRCRRASREVLAGLSVADAQLAFEAIRLANPGGLGEAARHDVREPAQVSLLEAMREAANRDSIARQYVSGYADVLARGLERLAAARAAERDRRWAATEVFPGLPLPVSGFPRGAQVRADRSRKRLRREACCARSKRPAARRYARDARALQAVGCGPQGTRPQPGDQRGPDGGHSVCRLSCSTVGW